MQKIKEIAFPTQIWNKIALESYLLRGYILGLGAPGTNAVGASGAINGMKSRSVTERCTPDGWTDVKVEIVV